MALKQCTLQLQIFKTFQAECRVRNQTQANEVCLPREVENAKKNFLASVLIIVKPEPPATISIHVAYNLYYIHEEA